MRRTTVFTESQSKPGKPGFFCAHENVADFVYDVAENVADFVYDVAENVADFVYDVADFGS